MFFKGKYKDLKGEFEREMKAASAGLEYEKAALMRDNMLALGLMGENVRPMPRAGRSRRRGPCHLAATLRSVTALQKALALSAPPVHVECFDISHFSGHQTVASMVCFVGGRPNRDHYRKFKIRDVAGIDDFKSMHEVVFRRYKRLQAEKSPLPDLVLIDGGKGQLGAAQAALSELKLKIPLASLAKRASKEVFLPIAPSPSIPLPIGDPALNLLQQLRDEAHRFGITYHRIACGTRSLFEA